MKNSRTFALALFFVAALAVASFAATSKDVSYKSGDETVHAIVYTPDGEGPFPGILVIHEWWGLNDWIKEQASKLADQGYVTLAIDPLPLRNWLTRSREAFLKIAPSETYTLAMSFSSHSRK
jgi:hypothetical protein